MTEPSPRWDWMLHGRFVGFCLTFTRGVPPAELLRRYGADPSSASTIAYPQIYDILQPGPDASILRVGILGEWIFCLETLGVEGIMPAALAALSQGTQTVAVNFGANAFHTLAHWVDGQPRESFEPGEASSLRARDAHPLWDAAEHHRAGHSDLRAVVGALEAVGDLVGGHLTVDIIWGPLLSALLLRALPRLPSPAAPLPLVHAPETAMKSLGPLLGRLRITPPTGEGEPGSLVWESLTPHDQE